jgi:hypothetical protein
MTRLGPSPRSGYKWDLKGKSVVIVEATQGSVGGKAAEKQLDGLKALVSALPA